MLPNAWRKRLGSASSKVDWQREHLCSYDDRGGDAKW